MNEFEGAPASGLLSFAFAPPAVTDAGSGSSSSGGDIEMSTPPVFILAATPPSTSREPTTGDAYPDADAGTRLRKLEPARVDLGSGVAVVLFEPRYGLRPGYRSAGGANARAARAHCTPCDLLRSFGIGMCTGAADPEAESDSARGGGKQRGGAALACRDEPRNAHTHPERGRIAGLCCLREELPPWPPGEARSLQLPAWWRGLIVLCCYWRMRWQWG